VISVTIQLLYSRGKIPQNALDRRLSGLQSRSEGSEEKKGNPAPARNRTSVKHIAGMINETTNLKELEICVQWKPPLQFLYGNYFVYRTNILLKRKLRRFCGSLNTTVEYQP
jgi:hypothetical protein